MAAPNDAQKFELYVRVEIAQPAMGSNRIAVEERVSLDAIGFMEICKSLGQFHDLAESMRKQND